ncbi:hypothetical protein [Streptomyces kronopolitis]|uniref:hypothetical protein n=1 Tax=Streptomyces kronopolitis TaxID=1612435 RepID=UPI0020BFB4E5|nr:hypothetical protein [Streptomyces kronopolitis]MCL6302844.1 hypothetical protein [Streptomyces kronopolitis]
MTAPSFRHVHKTHAEHFVPLPASLLDVAELLAAARSTLHDTGRTLTDATVHQDENELVISYPVDPELAELAQAVTRR